MVRSFGRQSRKTSAVEVDLVTMHVVGIFALFHPAGTEIHNAVRLINKIHRTHRPLALGNLLPHLSRFAVHQVKVFPSVPLAGPQDFFSIIQVSAEVLAVIVLIPLQRLIINECGAGFIDQSACFAGARIHFHHAIKLVAPLVVFKREPARVFPPLNRLHLKLIGKKRTIDLALFAIGYFEEHGLIERKHVPCFRINHGRVNRLELICRRRLDIVDLAFVAGTNPVDRDVFRIRRPGNGRNRVVIFGASFHA